MKILHICNDYLNTRLYGQLSSNLAQQNCKGLFYIPVRKGSNLNRTSEPNTLVSQCVGRFDRYFLPLKAHRLVCDIIKKLSLMEYNVIHGHTLFSNGYAAYQLNRKSGIPYVVSVRNTDVNVFFKYLPFFRPLGVQILKKASRIIFLSAAYRDFVIQKYVPTLDKAAIQRKSLVIPNGISSFFLENKAERVKQINLKAIRLISVCTIDENKNLIVTAQACKTLQNQGYQVCLSVAGEIMDRVVFNKLMAYGFVTYLGVLDQDALIKAYREYDIFVMPSIHETFGLVYAEAMSQGLPVIYTAGQGFDGHFPDGEIGYAVHCHDADEIAMRILDIYDHYETMRIHCIAGCEKFGWEKISAAHIKIYSEVVSSQFE